MERHGKRLEITISTQSKGEKHEAQDAKETDKEAEGIDQQRGICTGELARTRSG